MKNSRYLLVRSTSALALAACLITPGVAGAQTTGANATDAQPTTTAPTVAQATPGAAAFCS